MKKQNNVENGINDWNSIVNLIKNVIKTQTFLLLTALLILFLVFSIFEESFFTRRSITSMLFQLPEFGILSLAMMIPMMIGGDDLSIVSTANLSAILSGFFSVKVLPNILPEEYSIIYIGSIFLLSMIVGCITGLFNGILVGYIGANSILVTLSTLTFFTGISIGLTKGSVLIGLPESIGLIGSESILGIPISFLIFVVVSMVVFIILNHTPLGFKIRMMGTNQSASKFSGINNKKIIIKIFIISGILSSISGILIMSRTLSASYQYGASTYILLTILIGVLAGVVSGKGSVLNVFVSVLILQVISTGFHMMLVGIRGSSFFKDFIWGILLIVIFIINHYREKMKKLS